MSLLSRFLRIGCVLLGSASILPAHAIVATIDNFSVTRNGIVIFDDGFNDESEPPSAPAFSGGSSASYFVSGSFPDGSEIGGKLTIDTDNGEMTSNAAGAVRQRVNAQLQTSPTAGGLGDVHTLALQALFDLVVPSGPMYSGYGIQFADAAAGRVHQAAQLQVRFDPASGGPQVAYQFQDFDAGSITELGSPIPLAPPAGADQVLLRIVRPSASTRDFYASFAYLAGGVDVGGASFTTPAPLFDGEDFVRARFFAAAAVIPEPRTSALFGVGLVMLAVPLLLQRRRR